MILQDTRVNFTGEAIRIVPITQYAFAGDNSGSLNHGFDDIPFFPTWQEFLDRSNEQREDYQNYMTYLLCKAEDGAIIGVLAVQLTTYDSLKSKVFAAIPDIETYLYLSWIALDQQYQTFNYFALLFEFYQVLLRRFRRQYNTRIEGAAISMRRMRPLLWSLFNDFEPCPTTTNDSIVKESRRFTFVVQPCELFGQSITPVQDHILMLFKTSK